MIARPTVDLPHPDSPTSPSVSPRRIDKRHAVDGLYVPDVAIEDEPALDREPDPELFHLDERAAAVARGSGGHAASPPRRERFHSSAGTGLSDARPLTGIERCKQR